MKVLVYKRTHIGDPNDDGVFSINNCMGKIREYHYDAVIGIGGKKSWKGDENIANKLNWIGLKPKKIGKRSDYRAKYIVFDKFVLLNEKGDLLEDCCPCLFQYMESRRFKIFDLEDKDLDSCLKSELEKILERVKNVQSNNWNRQQKSEYIKSSIINKVQSNKYPKQKCSKNKC